MTLAPDVPKPKDKRAKNGGRRAGAGRKPGGKNKVQADLRAAAQQYTKEALDVLVAIARDKDASAAARVSAATAILDRAHGKPTQTIEGTGEGGAIEIRFVD